MGRSGNSQSEQSWLRSLNSGAAWLCPTYLCVSSFQFPHFTCLHRGLFYYHEEDSEQETKNHIHKSCHGEWFKIRLTKHNIQLVCEWYICKSSRVVSLNTKAAQSTNFLCMNVPNLFLIGIWGELPVGNWGEVIGGQSITEQNQSTAGLLAIHLPLQLSRSYMPQDSLGCLFS